MTNAEFWEKALQALKSQVTDEKWQKLPSRIQTPLAIYELKNGELTKEKLIKDIQSGKFHYKDSYFPLKTHAIKLLGKKGYQQLCDWLEIEPFKQPKHTPEKTINRCIAFLEKQGYTVTMEAK